MNKKSLLTFVAVSAIFVGAAGGNSGCSEQQRPAPTAAQVQEQAAIRAANTVRFNANAEIDNIRRRLELTSDPNLLGYIILLNDAGQPILYEGVRGKVTSGSKRLTPSAQVVMNPTYGSNGGQHSVVVPAPSDEGTHGQSNPYIFYWNTDGQYRQWSGQYLYSTSPIRLRIDPLVITAVPVEVNNAPSSPGNAPAGATR